MSDHSNAARMPAAWREAAAQLGIEVVAPFEVAGVSFAAYLPDFGGPQRMVISGLTSSAEDDAAAASEAGLYLSRVSDAYAEFDRSQFQAALDDWGWYGPAEKRSGWYTGAAWIE
jgi:hypothetical protein